MFVSPSTLLPSFTTSSNSNTSSLLYAYESQGKNANGVESSFGASGGNDAINACFASSFKTAANEEKSGNPQLSLLINRALLRSASSTAQSAANALFSETNTPVVGGPDGNALQRCACAFCGACPALLAVRNPQQNASANASADSGDLLRSCVTCVQRLNLPVLNLAVGTSSSIDDDGAPTPRIAADIDSQPIFPEQRAARHSSGATSTDSGTGGEPLQSAPHNGEFPQDFVDVFDAAGAMRKAAARRMALETETDSEIRALSVSSGTFSGVASGVNSNARNTPSKSVSSLAVGTGVNAASAPQSPSAAASSQTNFAFCQQHMGEPVRMFCRTCEQLVCQMCLFSDSLHAQGGAVDNALDHRQHDLQLVGTAVEHQAAVLRMAHQEAKAKLAEIRQMVVGMQQLSTRLVVQFQKSQTQIDDTATMIAKLIADRRAELQRALDASYQAHAAPISSLMQRAHEQLEKLQQLADFADKMLAAAANPLTPNRGIELLMLQKLFAGSFGALLNDGIPELTRQFSVLVNACTSGSTNGNGSTSCFSEMDYLVDEKLIQSSVPHLLGSFRCASVSTSRSESGRPSPIDSDLVDGPSRDRGQQLAGFKALTNTLSQQKLGGSALMNIASQHNSRHASMSQPQSQSQSTQHSPTSLASHFAQAKLNGTNNKLNGSKQSIGGLNVHAADYVANGQDASRTASTECVANMPLNSAPSACTTEDGNQMQLQALAALSAAGIDFARLNAAEQHALIARLRQQIEVNARLPAPLPLPQLVLSSIMNASATGGSPQLRSSTKRTKMIYHVKFGEFGVMNGQFTEPSGVAVSLANEIIVADTNNHRIQVFDAEGRFKFQFGECGKRDSQLLYPNRVAVNPLNGDIVVTERSPTHQIQVYSQNGQFLRKFGANVLQHPRGVTVDKQGRILVVECKVMRILIFDQMGNLLNKFGCSKYLEFPNAIAVNDKEEIFVSDNRAHCVKVFDYSGRFLRQVGGEGVTNYPIGVAVSSAGEVLVADNHNNFNLTVFDAQGELIGALESKVKHAQCFDIALLRDASDSIVLASKDYRLYVYRYRNPTPVSD